MDIKMNTLRKIVVNCKENMNLSQLQVSSGLSYCGVLHVINELTRRKIYITKKLGRQIVIFEGQNYKKFKEFMQLFAEK